MSALQWAWQATHHRVGALALDLKKRPATDDAVTGQECVHLGGNTILNPPRQILKLDLGPMSRSRCSNQNFQIDLRQKYQTSWRAILARKNWMKSKKRRKPNFNGVAISAPAK